jgi:hypothetical protein
MKALRRKLIAILARNTPRLTSLESVPAVGRRKRGRRREPPPRLCGPPVDRPGPPAHDPPVSWRVFEAAAPDLAAFAAEQFSEAGVGLLGTIRRDGSPRISCVLPFVMDGDLYMGMLWRSRKALDLLRDPRLTLRNAICTNTGSEAEISLRGRAVEALDQRVRARYVGALWERTEWTEPFHLFSVEIERASLIRYGGGQQTVKLWPEGTERVRPYG